MWTERGHGTGGPGSDWLEYSFVPPLVLGQDWAEVGQGSAQLLGSIPTASCVGAFRCRRTGGDLVLWRLPDPGASAAGGREQPERAAVPRAAEQGAGGPAGRVLRGPGALRLAWCCLL